MSALDDLATLAVVGVAGFVGYEVVVNQKSINEATAALLAQFKNAGATLNNLPQTITQAGQTAATFENDNTGTTAFGAGLVSQDKLCADILAWQTNQQSYPARWIWGDPFDWNAFRNYVKIPFLGQGYDPGPNAPGCWYTTPYFQPAGAGTGFQQDTYEGLPPGALGL